MKEITIATRHGLFLLDADVEGGLALHPGTSRADAGLYTLTHVASGRGICYALPWLDAEDLRRALLASDIDWSLSQRELEQQHGPAIAQLLAQLLGGPYVAWLISFGAAATAIEAANAVILKGGAS